MSTNTNDIKTEAFVLRRTNYGEADRILNLITPNHGKLSAIAKGVRKEKSKLAGGVEMFSLIELNIHQSSKSEFGIITSSKMLKFYGEILKDLDRMELAALILKKISLAAESSDSPDFFKIVANTFPALNNGTNLELIETWFLLNLTKASGEQINLYFDVNGDKLNPNQTYTWSTYDAALMADLQGNIAATEIKFLRLMLSADLATVARVKNCEPLLPKVLKIARVAAKM